MKRLVLALLALLFATPAIAQPPPDAQWRLGRLPGVVEKSTPRFAAYAKDVPDPPASVDWGKPVKVWPMMANDVLGDCTIATAGHLIQEWTANSYGGPGHVVVDLDIVQAYSDVSGYKPGIPQTDQGAVVLDVLKYWRSKGVGGHKIWAFASVSPGNTTAIKQTVWLFGGCYLGVDLPLAAQGQTGPGKVWDLPPGQSLRGIWRPGSWGGHAVPVVAYDRDGLTCVTWGRLQRVSWRWLSVYCSEAWAIIGGSDWMKGRDPVAPNGFKLKQLQDDMAKVSQ